MNREIKFRAWDKKEKKFLNDFVIDLNGVITRMHKTGSVGKVDKSIGDYYELDFTDFYGIENIELMQFTGLSDKNGKEIYEGDVVQLDMSNPPYQTDTLIVIWECASFLLAPRTDETGGYSLYLINSPNIEIIGNIYQHGYLLDK